MVGRRLVCENCGAEYPEGPRWLCERCFELLRVRYGAEGGRLKAGEIANRDRDIWRYLERLPVDSRGASEAGWTRLVEAKRLGEALGLVRLYVKDEGTGSPTGCLADRGAAVAMSKAGEFGFKAVACATMGSDAVPVAAACARAGVACYVFAPVGGELDRLCSASRMGAHVVLLEGGEAEAELFCREAGEEYGWGFLNLHLKAFWAEGVKTFIFELAEQMGWRLPGQLVVYLGSGVLAKESVEGREELVRMGLVEDGEMAVYGVQTESCAPIARALLNEDDWVTAWEKPSREGPSDPAWGDWAMEAISRSNGLGESVTDEEARKGRKLLGETEGLLRGARTGAAVWAAKKLAEKGKLNPEAVTVIAATERAAESGASRAKSFPRIRPRLSDFDRLMKNGFG
jgi:threonine synthase